MHHWTRWGLTEGHRTHLVLTSTRKVKKDNREHRKYQITITENETIETIAARLNAKLLEEHARQMNFHRRVARFTRKGNKRQAKSSDMTITDRTESLPELPAFSLSLRNIAKLLNVSHIKAKEIILMLNNLKVIATTKTKPKGIIKVPGVKGKQRPRAAKKGRGYVDLTEGLPGHLFCFNGIIYQVFGNRHRFLEHSPCNDDLTYKQYIYAYKKGSIQTKNAMTGIYAMNTP